MKLFNPECAIRLFQYHEHFTSPNFFSIAMTYHNGSHLDDELPIKKMFLFTPHTLKQNKLVTITAHEQITEVLFALIENDAILPQYQISIVTNLGSIDQEFTATASEIMSQWGLFDQDTRGYLLFDNTDFRNVKQLKALEINKLVQNDNYLFIKHYSDNSFFSSNRSKNHITKRYKSKLFCDPQALIAIDSLFLEKNVKKKQIESVNFDWYKIINSAPNSFKVDIFFTDGSVKIKKLDAEKITRKYSPELINYNRVPQR